MIFYKNNIYLNLHDFFSAKNLHDKYSITLFIKGN